MSADATSIILHQYDISPFSEKVRVVFGIKGLDWFACDEPVIMPKPELVALTGGYRKIPVMQIGADIYCDTQIIIRELERRFPKPSVFVGGDKGLGWGMGLWTDRSFFMAAVAVIFGNAPDAMGEDFKADRTKLMGRPFDTEAMKAGAPLMAEQLRANFGWLEEQLADGRKFLMGEAPGIADANAYYNLAFIRWIVPAAMKSAEAMPHLAAWEKRVKAVGHGNRQEISREAALDIAKAATSTETVTADPGEPNGLKPGDRVTVMADDYGRDPIAGELVSSSAQHIALKRSDPRVGEVVVHFPRAGFLVMRG
ncbi:MAG: glutathione S-transferase family protein [Parvibaculum sp.]|uniref:glutathione S-transferase family protein n=1 Tax=Parvibaculum sp. TaxID=2024848 RepID=UPI002718C30D|nr:glutathione S-transferase family protein [Parvibaculum sp.]MDO8837941.1 glutathione S-transferase family protein [Parvibaculum sp.]